MAYEDYLASGGWTSLPPPVQPTGLLSTGLTPYQKAMAQMQEYQAAQDQRLNSLLGTSGGYRPGIFGQRSASGLLSQLGGITDIRGGGGARSPAEQARINAFFDAMTPAELAEFQQKNADVINMILGPKLLMMAYDAITGQNKPTMVESSYTPPAQIVNAMGGMSAYKPNIFTPTVTPVVTVGDLTPTTTPEGSTASNLGAISIPVPTPNIVVTDLGLLSAPSVASGGGGTVSSGGVSASSGSPMGGIASSGTSGQAAAANAAAAAAAAAGVGTGGVSTSSGSPMGGISSGGGSAASGGTGGGGGGGGCCFIMLEARYGDGTMDAVVRRYRDEKITDRNKRGYYKLAEVFVPLMRESRLFKFMVAKTFADPLVSYGKWHYGQNRHGWIFKPVERFWMKIFNVLGNDTKFIRENGETV